MKKMVFGVVLYAFSIGALANFQATSKIEANVCTGFVIKSCGFESLDAVGQDGKLYEPSRTYEQVSSYSNGRCTIQIKGNEVISNLINRTNSPEFYTLEDGSYKKINPEYLTFKCSQSR